MTGLWEAHRGDASETPRSFGRLYLPDAFDDIGAALFGTDWTSEEVEYEDGEFAAVPHTSQAFVDGKAVDSVHTEHSATMKKLHQEALANRLLRASDDGDTTVAEKAANALGIAMISETIYPDEWDIAYEHAALRDGGPERLRLLSNFLYAAIEGGGVAVFIRPIGGGSVGAMPVEHWEVDDYLRRMAMASYDPARPFDMGAEPTHHIFVSADDVDELIRSVVSARQPDGDLSTPGRPMLVQRVMPEFARRLEAGEVLSSIAAEARALAAWDAARNPLHEGKKPIRPKAIEPYIRDAINNAKAAGVYLIDAGKGAGN